MWTAASGSPVTHTTDQALFIYVLYRLRAGRLSYRFAALQDRRALLSCYVIFNVTTRIDSPCSGLSRQLAVAPSHTLRRHIPSCCFCFSPCREGWTACAVFRELAVVDSPLRSFAKALCLRDTRGCDARSHVWVVCENSPFHPTVTPARQHQTCFQSEQIRKKRQRQQPLVTEFYAGTE